MNKQSDDPEPMTVLKMLSLGPSRDEISCSCALSMSSVSSDLALSSITRHINRILLHTEQSTALIKEPAEIKSIILAE